MLHTEYISNFVHQVKFQVRNKQHYWKCVRYDLQIVKNVTCSEGLTNNSINKNIKDLKKICSVRQMAEELVSLIPSLSLVTLNASFMAYSR